ncbi:MAG: thiamine pyrophosphate-binding protein, partial [Candidatus Methylomirabilia bacterium]
MSRISGAHLLMRSLKRHGVDRIFGLCGDHVNAIFNACLDEGIAIVDVRQESAATHMADGWARVTGQPGVSVVTGGPGHTNSITGIATAWMACSPIITISGM